MDKIGLIKLTFDGTKTLASRFLFSPPPSEKILDPMSTIIRLALLSYYETGTKLSIHDNSLFLQEPSYYQGSLRWGYSDNKEDLHNLHNPIAKALNWYDLKIDYVKHIFIRAKKGLEGLKKCYKGTNESNLVCHSLNYYAKMIDLKINTLNQNTSQNASQTVPQNAPQNVSQDASEITLSSSNMSLQSNLSDQSVQSEQLQMTTMLEDTFANLDTNIYNHTGITKLKEYWTYNEFKLINDMFKMTDEYKLKGDDLRPMLASINRIVKGKDIKVQNLIIKLTTTLTN